MAKEIELKFDLLNKQEIEDFLNQNGVFEKESNQLDIYYDLPHRSFLENKDKVREWLRLRESDKGCSINYKDWGDNSTPMCEEYEENIADIKIMQKIFDMINLKEIMRVDKNRKIWNYKGYTVCVDTVKDLGDFIEIETIEENGEALSRITKEIYSIKEELGVKANGVNKTGYPYELMKKQGLV